MGEDVSAQIRTGLVVILVGALITIVLNLMAVASNITSNGLTTLESGVDQVTAQEYEKYNQGKFSGTSVRAAIGLYSGKDIAIVVRTGACVKGTTGTDNAWGYIYGTLITDSNGSAPTKLKDSEDSDYYVLTGAEPLKRKAGQPYYEAEYYISNGITAYCLNTKEIQVSSSPKVITTESRFISYLVKNQAGQTIGIVFEQIV